MPMAWITLSVASAYFLSVQIGLALTFPPATTSVLWPPNAVLTAILLLLPRKQWWVCLAALPVQVFLETKAGFSPLLATMLFLTNCSEAFVGASGLRALSPTPTRFDSLRAVVTFICVVGFFSPMASSFVDAAVVTALRDESYWHVWRTRTFANTLTELSVVPAIILGCGALLHRRRPTRLRAFEAVAFAGTGLLVAMFVFGDTRLSASMPGIPRTPTVLLLPLFFWGAVRFGVGGVSAALLGTASVASISAALGHRPFGVLPPLESLLAVQMYLVVMGVPLMCLAGLLDERRRAAADLAERLRFEELVAFIASSFVRPAGAESRSVYITCLARIATFLRADYATLQAVGTRDGANECLRRWRTPANAPNILDPLCALFPSLETSLASGETLQFESLDALPDEQAASARHTIAALGIHSAVITPFAARGALRGALAVATRERRHWQPRELEQIRMLAEVLSNASAREEAEFEVQWMRQELAQVARLVSLGELTSSLAHELNQPLTGILCNAQAAARMLQDDEPCQEELSAIVADIVDDNRRASEVIQRMRDVLSQDNEPPESLDLNQIIRDVASLITSETIIRNVSVTLRLTPEPVTVLAARAELQQAVLNVLTYAIRAVADRDIAERLIEVVVEAATDDQTPARVTVRHPGVVVVSSVQEDLFAPCFVPGASRLTTGLDVARVIVERNGGTIAADSLHGAATAIVIAMPKNET